MKQQVLLFGFLMASLLLLLKYFEYNYFIKSFSQEVYIGSIALFFTLLGSWIAYQLIKRNGSSEQPIKLNKKVQVELKLSDRETEVLLAMAEGLSNKEIANKLFLSESTIKTHVSKLFFKLDVKRRTQAVLRAKEIGILQ